MKYAIFSLHFASVIVYRSAKVIMRAKTQQQNLQSLHVLSGPLAWTPFTMSLAGMYGHMKNAHTSHA